MFRTLILNRTIISLSIYYNLLVYNSNKFKKEIITKLLKGINTRSSGPFYTNKKSSNSSNSNIILVATLKTFSAIIIITA